MRLLKLVNTLLDFSRIEAGRMQANFEPVDLPAFTAELASSFRSTIERAGLRLVVDCRPLPEQVYVNRDMWEKVVLNSDFERLQIHLRRWEIAVECRPCFRSGRRVAVRDTGTGISAEELPHLFERFRRVESARGRSIEGSGIGLALVQELVRLHGGEIRVESRVGRGTAFTVTVPFGVDHLPSDRISHGPVAAATSLRARAYVDEATGWVSEGAAGSDLLETPSASEDLGDLVAAAGALAETILLADDNADMRNYIERLLRSAGFIVEAVTDGEMALAAARRTRPDLVLSDVMMPNLDGFGLLAALREEPEFRDVPVLLLSARAGEEAKIEGLTAGADDYLTKPFSARELLARVRANLDMAAMRREALRAENELRRQAEMAQERAEGILASITDGFVALDPDWRFIYVNAAAERMMGRPHEGLIGKSFWEEYPRVVGTTLEVELRRAMAERVSIAFEHRASSGRWYDLRFYPTRDGNLSLYFQDISDRKEAVEALLRLNETLKVQIAERIGRIAVQGSPPARHI